MSSFRVSVVRPDDLLVATFHFINLRVVAEHPGKLPSELRPTGEGRSLIVLELPPQHIAEEAFHEGAPEFGEAAAAEPSGLARRRISAPSRMAFEVGPSPENPLYYTLEDILRVCSTYATMTGESPVEPGRPLTCIEVPFRLELVPATGRVTWTHRLRPFASGRSELWHTTITRGDPATSRGERSTKLHVLGARDAWIPDSPTSPREPFTTSLTSKQRLAIAAQSNAEVYGSPAIQARRLSLSALGAWVDLEGSWEPQPGVSLTSWVHRATMGRDQFVRVVEEGFLFPFGHRAAKVTISERKLTGDGLVAYLRQRTYIVVRELERAYGDATRSDRELPFSRVVFVTRVTPNLDPPSEAMFWPQVAGRELELALYGVDREGRRIDFAAPCRFVDATLVSDASVAELVRKYDADERRALRPLGGQRLAFAKSDRPGDTSFEAASLTFGAASEQGTSHPFRPIMKQASVDLPAARHLAAGPASTSIALDELYLDHEFGAAENPGQVFARLTKGLKLDFSQGAERSGALVQPTMEIKALSRSHGPVAATAQQLAGDAGSTDRAQILEAILGSVTLLGVVPLGKLLAPAASSLLGALPTFASRGLDEALALWERVERLRRELALLREVDGLGEALAAQLASTGVSAALVSSMLTAAPGPSALVEALTAFRTELEELAALLQASVDSIHAGTVPPAIYDVRRPLEDLLHASNAIRDTIGSAEGFAKKLALPRETKLAFEWSPALPKADDKAIFLTRNGDTSASFTVRAEVTTSASTSGAPAPGAGMSAVARLENFTLQLVPPAHFLSVAFRTIEFRLGDGSKAELDVILEKDGIAFAGPLTFVNALRDLIPAAGFSDPPFLDVSREEIAVGFTIGVPNVTVGVFALQNINLGARLEIPIIGARPLTVGFSFATRENPFLLTVSCFGGGGFFAVKLAPDGMKRLEAAFEFGASIALNVGVASGEVHVFGGVYFCMEKGGAELTAYLRMGGSVEVLGIVSVSIELYIALTYDTHTKKLWGSGVLTLEVEVLFFSKSFTVHVERRLSGSGEDPAFEQMIQPSAFEAYCTSFAPEPADHAATSEIGVDARALAPWLFRIAGTNVSWFDATSIHRFTLAPGEHRLEITTGVTGFTWRTTSAGTVDYEPHQDAYLRGRGTPVLVLVGFPVRFDCTGLASRLFMINGMDTGWRSSTEVQELHMLPGRYCIQTLAGVTDMVFTVGADGTLAYDVRLDARLRGRGGTTLVALGLGVDIDCTRLTSPLFMIVGMETSWRSTQQVHHLQLSPGRYGIQTLAGVTGLVFTVSEDGKLGYDAAFDTRFTGRGGTTLTVHPSAVRIDLTGLSLQLVMIQGVDTTWRAGNVAHDLQMLPGTYGFQTLSGFSALRFRVTDAGTFDYDPEHQGPLSGKGTTTLVVSRL